METAGVTDKAEADLRLQIGSVVFTIAVRQCSSGPSIATKFAKSITKRFPSGENVSRSDIKCNVEHHVAQNLLPEFSRGIETAEFYRYRRRGLPCEQS